MACTPESARGMRRHPGPRRRGRRQSRTTRHVPRNPLRDSGWLPWDEQLAGRHQQQRVSILPRVQRLQQGEYQGDDCGCGLEQGCLEHHRMSSPGLPRHAAAVHSQSGPGAQAGSVWSHGALPGLPTLSPVLREPSSIPGCGHAPAPSKAPTLAVPLKSPSVVANSPSPMDHGRASGVPGSGGPIPTSSCIAEAQTPLPQSPEKPRASRCPPGRIPPCTPAALSKLASEVASGSYGSCPSSLLEEGPRQHCPQPEPEGWVARGCAAIPPGQAGFRPLNPSQCTA